MDSRITTFITSRLPWLLCTMLCASCASQPKIASSGLSATQTAITPPPLKPIQALTLPERNYTTLSNGLRVLLVPDSRLPLIDVRLHLLAGSIDEQRGKLGVATFTGDMLRQGVRGLTADQISKRIDDTGASLDVSTGYETTTIACGGRQRTLPICLDIVSRMAMQPTFAKNEMQQVRQQLVGAIKRARDNPHELAGMHFRNMLYGDNHPGGLSMDMPSVMGITPADLRQFHRTRYVPRAAILVISGAIDVPQATKAIAKTFGRWADRKLSPRTTTPVSDPAPGFHVLLVDKPDLSQSFFVLGHAGIPITDPDRDVLRLDGFVLGEGGFSSRLMKEVRAKGGKTYGISSAFRSHDVDGHFVVGSFTRNEQIVQMLQLVRHELEKIRTEPPTAEELSKAKGHIAGGYALRFQTGSAWADALAIARIHGLDETYVSELPVRLQRIDEKAAAAAARKHFRPGRLVCAIVGKASVVAPLLKKAGWSFEQVSYLAPISRSDRSAQKAPSGARR